MSVITYDGKLLPATTCPPQDFEGVLSAMLSCIDELVYKSRYSPTTENIVKVKQQGDRQMLLNITSEQHRNVHPLHQSKEPDLNAILEQQAQVHFKSQFRVRPNKSSVMETSYFYLDRITNGQCSQCKVVHTRDNIKATLSLNRCPITRKRTSGESTSANHKSYSPVIFVYEIHCQVKVPIQASRNCHP